MKPAPPWGWFVNFTPKFQGVQAINPAPRQPFRLPGTTAHGARTVRHVSRTKRQAPQNRFTPTKTTRKKVSNQAQSPGIAPILGKTGAG
jgi:hypothetical protein